MKKELEKIKKAIKVCESIFEVPLVDSDTLLEKLQKEAKKYLLVQLESVLESLNSDRLINIKNLTVIENGQPQAGVENYFCSNKTKNKFAVTHICYNELTNSLDLYIDTRGKND